jgi:hydroxyacylglutathione hydrolase
MKLIPAARFPGQLPVAVARRAARAGRRPRRRRSRCSAPGGARPATGRDSSHASPRRSHRGRGRLREATGARVYGPGRRAHSRPFTPLRGRRDRRARACASGPRRARAHRRPHRLYCPRTSTARRCCSAATRCSPAVAAACSRARRRRCSPRWTSWRPCPAIPGVLHPRIHAVNLRLPQPSSLETPAGPYQQQCEAGARAASPPCPPRRRGGTRINPFLRTRQPAVAQAAHGTSTARIRTTTVAVFAAIRQWKNEFR